MTNAQKWCRRTLALMAAFILGAAGPAPETEKVMGFGKIGGLSAGMPVPDIDAEAWVLSDEAFCFQEEEAILVRLISTQHGGEVVSLAGEPDYLGSLSTTSRKFRTAAGRRVGDRFGRIMKSYPGATVMVPTDAMPGQEGLRVVLPGDEGAFAFPFDSGNAACESPQSESCWRSMRRIKSIRFEISAQDQ